MTYPEEFKQNKYLNIKGLIPLNLCKVITHYALLQERTNFMPEPTGAQVENAHSVYSDTLMETMLHFLQPHLEEKTGCSLCPTYSYFRVYRPSMKLNHHLDRPSCEISTTVCFGFNYPNVNPDYRWGMYVGNGKLLTQDPGDLIVYRGCEVDHWRDEFLVGSGGYQVQAFFHYIDKNGPFYPEYAYDKRPGLGYRDRQKHINN